VSGGRLGPDGVFASRLRDEVLCEPIAAVKGQSEAKKTMDAFGFSDTAAESGPYGHAKFVQEKCIDVCGALDTFVERGVDVVGV
jgi:hypothetical protein